MAIVRGAPLRMRSRSGATLFKVGTFGRTVPDPRADRIGATGHRLPSAYAATPQTLKAAKYRCAQPSTPDRTGVDRLAFGQLLTWTNRAVELRSIHALVL